MKKSLYCVFMAVCLFAVSVTFSSCGRKHVLIDDELPQLPDPVQPVTDVPVVIEEQEDVKVTIDMNDPDPAPHLRWGVWYAYSETGSSYYFFENDNTSGVKISVQSGIASPFRYEKSEDGSYVFHFDREDNNTLVNVDFQDTENAKLTIHGGAAEQLEYISSQTYSQFLFYTNDELSNMAMSAYSKIETNPVRLKRIQMNIIEKPGSEVVIQFVRKTVNNETQKEELTVCESYTVNRITAEGVDSSGAVINLSK